MTARVRHPARRGVLGNAGNTATWGSITGTLSNQSDLQAALNTKLENLVEDTTPQLGGNLDAQSNNITALASLTMDGTLTIEDATNTDSVAFSHDGTDLNTTFTTTADWNISGLTGHVIFSQNGNAFTDAAIHVTGDAAAIMFIEEDQTGGDEKIWTWGVGSRNFRLRTFTDAESAGSDAFVATRSSASTDISSVTLGGAEVYLAGENTGHFEAVTGTYGSVQVDGDEGSSSGYAGYNIQGEFAFIWNDASNLGAIYFDTPNDFAMLFREGGEVELAYNGVIEFETLDSNATGATSGASVRDHTQTFRDVGFNTLSDFNTNSSDTLEASHCGAMVFTSNATSYTLTLEANTSTDFPVDGIVTVVNAGSSDYTITEGTGTTLYYVDPGTGRTDTAGGCVVGAGGVATIWRQAAAVYYIWGSEITP